MNAVRSLAGIAAITLAAMLPLQIDAQEDAGLRLQITRVEDGAYPNARLVVGVEDATGAGEAIAQGDWQVSVGGTPVDVVSAELASSEDAPLDVLFVFDASTSLAGVPLDSAKVAGNTLLQTLAPEDRVAIMRFNDDVVLLQDYTSDRGLLAQAIGALQATGNTAFYQATYDGAVSVGTGSQAARKAVVLLSDGAEFGNKSLVTREEALAAAEFVGVPFFIVAFGNEVDRPYLSELAARTNGRLFEAPGPADLEALYASIGRLLRSQYIITFDASTAAADAASDVTVTLAQGERNATATTQYTPGAGFLPQVSISGISAGDRVTAPREITATVSGGGAPKLTWYVDDINVQEHTAPPYVFTLDPAEFEGGAHALRVVVGDVAVSGEGIAFSSTPPPAAASGGSPMLVYVGIGGLVGLIAAFAFFFLRSKRKPVERAIPADQRTTSWAKQVAQRAATTRPAEGDTPDVAGAPEQIGQALGMLVSRAGTDLGKEYRVGGKPVSIGAGSRCGVRIDDPALAFEEARIWVRDGHLMLHKFTRLTAMELDGTGGGWEILEPGDRFEIGQHTFEFKLITEGAGDGPPNVLRDPTTPEPGETPRRFSDMMPRAD